MFHRRVPRSGHCPAIPRLISPGEITNSEVARDQAKIKEAARRTTRLHSTPPPIGAAVRVQDIRHPRKLWSIQGKVIAVRPNFKSIIIRTDKTQKLILRNLRYVKLMENKVLINSFSQECSAARSCLRGAREESLHRQRATAGPASPEAPPHGHGPPEPGPPEEHSSPNIRHRAAGSDQSPHSLPRRRVTFNSPPRPGSTSSPSPPDTYSSPSPTPTTRVLRSASRKSSAMTIRSSQVKSNQVKARLWTKLWELVNAEVE